MGAAEQNSSPQKQPYRTEQDAIESSVALVRDYASRFEQNYARPALDSSWALFEARPALAIFIAIFAFLSFIPVVSFLGVCIFVIVSFTAIALACGFVAISAVLLALSSIIFLILCVTLLASLFLTMAVVSFYMLFRLAVLIRQDGPSGISNWAGEAKQHFFGDTKAKLTNRDPTSDELSEKSANFSLFPDDHYKVQD